jgi:hypothetical protein
MRTAAPSGFRADIASALSIVRGRPYLWLLGIIGFSLRGGIVLLTLPIIVLPTQVEVRLALGNSLTSTGLADGFWLLAAGATLLTLAVLLLVLVALARLEIATFRQLVDDPHSADQRFGAEPHALDRRARRALISRLYVVQSTALVAILLSAIPLAAGLGDATLRELVAPSSSDPVFVRVLSQVRELVLVVVATVFVAELFSATASRRLLIRATGLTRRGTFTRHPRRMLAVAVLGWGLFIGALTAAAWAISVAWEATRSVFLSAGWSGQAEQAVALMAASVLLAAVFALVLLACGIVSALRGSLWSLASLR